MLTVILEVIFAVVFMTCHNLLPYLYTDNAEAISIASTMLILAAIFQISDGLQAVAAGALRGMQDVSFLLLIAFISYLAYHYPVMLFTGF
jgi:MATE family multidrug resistance protein